MSKPWSSGPTLKLYLKRLCMRRNYEFIFEVSDSTRSHFYRLISLSLKKEKNQMELGLSLEITLGLFVFKLQIKM